MTTLDSTNPSQFKFLVEHMPVMVNAVNENGVILVWNKECEKVTGYAASEVVGNKDVWKKLYPDEEYLKSLFNEWREAEELHEKEYKLRAKDGTYRYIAWSNVSKLYPIDGWYSWAIGHDVTKSHLLEESKKDSERKLSTLVDNIPCMVYRTKNDSSWYMYEVSGTAQELTGFSAKEFTSLMVLYKDLIIENYRHKIWDEIQAAIENKSSFVLTYQIKTKFDETKWVWEKGAPVFDDNSGELLYIEGVIFDITEQKMTKHELEKQKELVVSQSKAAIMSEMIGLIAHQWRQPLSVISTGASGMKIQKQLGELTDEYFIHTCDSINDNAQYLAKTIDTFRDFLQPNYEKSIVSVESVINGSLEILTQTFINNNIELIKELSTDLEIRINPSELMEVILNLVDNSKDAFNMNHLANRKLWIRAFEQEESLVLEIEDNAGGIIVNELEKIFDPYFTTKNLTQGAGLGLYIVKTIIEEHCGGTLSVENTENGALFRISLPLS